jgi:hypothetical protein
MAFDSRKRNPIRARVYNELIPEVPNGFYGAVNNTTNGVKDLNRIAAMGFTHVWVNPFFMPSQRTSLDRKRLSPYALYDYLRYDDRCARSNGSAESAATQAALEYDIKEFTKAAAKAGVEPVFDLVLRHVAHDNPIVKGQSLAFQVGLLINDLILPPINPDRSITLEQRNRVLDAIKNSTSVIITPNELDDPAKRADARKRLQDALVADRHPSFSSVNTGYLPNDSLLTDQQIFENFLTDLRKISGLAANPILKDRVSLDTESWFKKGFKGLRPVKGESLEYYVQEWLGNVRKISNSGEGREQAYEAIYARFGIIINDETDLGNAQRKLMDAIRNDPEFSQGTNDEEKFQRFLDYIEKQVPLGSPLLGPIYRATGDHFIWADVVQFDYGGLTSNISDFCDDLMGSDDSVYKTNMCDRINRMFSIDFGKLVIEGRAGETKSLLETCIRNAFKSKAKPDEYGIADEWSAFLNEVKKSLGDQRYQHLKAQHMAGIRRRHEIIEQFWKPVISHVINNLGFVGARLDATMYVPKEALQELLPWVKKACNARRDRYAADLGTECKITKDNDALILGETVGLGGTPECRNEDLKGVVTHSMNSLFWSPNPDSIQVGDAHHKFGEEWTVDGQYEEDGHKKGNWMAGGVGNLQEVAAPSIGFPGSHDEDRYPATLLRAMPGFAQRPIHNLKEQAGRDNIREWLIRRMCERIATVAFMSHGGWFLQRGDEFGELEWANLFDRPPHVHNYPQDQTYDISKFVGEINRAVSLFPPPAEGEWFQRMFLGNTPNNDTPKEYPPAQDISKDVVCFLVHEGKGFNVPAYIAIANTDPKNTLTLGKNEIDRIVWGDNGRNREHVANIKSNLKKEIYACGNVELSQELLDAGYHIITRTPPSVVADPASDGPIRSQAGGQAHGT